MIHIQLRDEPLHVEWHVSTFGVKDFDGEKGRDPSEVEEEVLLAMDPLVQSLIEQWRQFNETSNS